MAEVVVGWAELYHAGDGWRFRIKARNGEVVATGESYTEKRNAEAALIALVGTEVEVREVDS